MNQLATIFDRKRVALHRNRAAAYFADYDFLLRESAERLVERLDESTRHFPVVLDLGAHTGQLARIIRQRVGTEMLVQMDLSEKMLARSEGPRVVADEELLPFAPQSFDLIVSALDLHAVNDLPGALIQLRQSLKTDGMFMVSMLGGNTLTELRQVMMDVEMELHGGASPHISPFVDIKDAGALMQRAGFSMPVVDSDSITVSYENSFKLMADLRGMGESNALTASGKYVGKEGFGRIAEAYARLFPAEDGRITATFDIITMMGMG